MFEVKKPKMINKTFRLPEDLTIKLQKVAQQNGVSMNYLVQKCCEFALDSMDTKDIGKK